MKYFIDTEFHEEKNSIDLISIGIVSEDTQENIDFNKELDKTDINLKLKEGKEYYAISKDFDIKKAWNAWRPKKHNLPMGILNGRFLPFAIKEYWLRENVLKLIFKELIKKDKIANPYQKYITDNNSNIIKYKFSFRNFKKLIKRYGKPNKQIAEEIKNFCKSKVKFEKEKDIPEFYGYYADCDWVVFCWLFGKMIDLPFGFPMYCKDLKQMLDEKYMNQKSKYSNMSRLDAWLQDVKKYPNYPEQSNEHNALADDKWNKKLYKFLKTI